MELPRVSWDWGTAYDLFSSLEVLFRPEDYGVRRAWAAGVRARLPSAERQTLDVGQFLCHGPLVWVHSLPPPKDSTTLLWTLAQVPEADRIPLLANAAAELPEGAAAVLRGVTAREMWTEKDREQLRAAYQGHHLARPSFSVKELTLMLEWWARPAESGARLLEALRLYHEVFFAEQERRIRPALQQALSRAQSLAERLPLPELLEELSQGLRFEEPPGVAEVVLVPSYWTTPLMGFGTISPERELWLFGARPRDASLVPGAEVPDALLQVLEALSDPTRLRILQYLAAQRLTQAELARRLRLRAPTITHHLDVLRLAGLVQRIIAMDQAKEVKYYAARPAAVQAAFSALDEFLHRK